MVLADHHLGDLPRDGSRKSFTVFFLGLRTRATARPRARLLALSATGSGAPRFVVGASERPAARSSSSSVRRRRARRAPRRARAHRCVGARATAGCGVRSRLTDTRRRMRARGRKVARGAIGWPEPARTRPYERERRDTEQHQRDLPTVGEGAEAAARAVAVHALGKRDGAALRARERERERGVVAGPEVRVLERRRIGQIEDLAAPDISVRDQGTVGGADEGRGAVRLRPRSRSPAVDVVHGPERRVDRRPRAVAVGLPIGRSIGQVVQVERPRAPDDESPAGGHDCSSASPSFSVSALGSRTNAVESLGGGRRRATRVAARRRGPRATAATRRSEALGTGAVRRTGRASRFVATDRAVEALGDEVRDDQTTTTTAITIQMRRFAVAGRPAARLPVVGA